MASGSINKTPDVENSIVNGVRVFGGANNFKRMTIRLPGSNYVFGPILVLIESSLLCGMLYPSTTSLTKITGNIVASVAYDSSAYTYTITFSGASQLICFIGGSAGRYAEVNFYTS